MISKKSKTRSQFNLYRVLRFIWLEHRISRIELCRKLGLDKATMSTIVSFLIDLTIVEEIQPKTNQVKPGRKPIGLGIRKDFGFFLGFEFHNNGINVVVKDMHSSIVHQMEFPQAIKREQIKTSFFSVYNEIRNIMPDITILGVGVSIPGIVNHEQGLIMYSRKLGIESEPFDFHSEVFANLDIPGFIDNDANCCARGILTDLRTYEYDNFIYSLFNYEPQTIIEDNEDCLGIGFGIVIGGKLLHGPDFTAGEFQTLRKEDHSSNQLNLNRKEQNLYPVNRELQEQIFHDLSSHLAMFINVFNFKHIFLGGDIPVLVPDLNEKLASSINRNWVYHNEEKCSIHIQSNEDMSPASGAAGMFLEQLFTVPELDHDRGAAIWQQIFNSDELICY